MRSDSAPQRDARRLRESRRWDVDPACGRRSDTFRAGVRSPSGYNRAAEGIMTGLIVALLLAAPDPPERAELWIDCVDGDRIDAEVRSEHGMMGRVTNFRGRDIDLHIAMRSERTYAVDVLRANLGEVIEAELHVTSCREARIQSMRPVGELDDEPAVVSGESLDGSVFRYSMGEDPPFTTRAGQPSDLDAALLNTQWFSFLQVEDLLPLAAVSPDEPWPLPATTVESFRTALDVIQPLGIFIEIEEIEPGVSLRLVRDGEIARIEADGAMTMNGTITWAELWGDGRSHPIAITLNLDGTRYDIDLSRRRCTAGRLRWEADFDVDVDAGPTLEMRLNSDSSGRYEWDHEF